MAETILIVEDDPHVLLSYEEILRSSGYAVVKAESGEAAERILRTSSIDIAITDLKMPKMGGLEVLRIARNVDPETIVILITAYPTVDTAVEAMKFGACDYLVKPFSVEQLRAAVKDALEKRKTKDAYALLKSQLRSSFAVSGIVGQSRAILKLFDWMRKVAALSADLFFFFQAEDGIRDLTVTGVQTCALPIYHAADRDCARGPDGYLFRGERHRPAPHLEPGDPQPAVVLRRVPAGPVHLRPGQIGRASCRERV